jgi:hypothetical protein
MTFDARLTFPLRGEVRRHGPRSPGSQRGGASHLLSFLKTEAHVIAGRGALDDPIGEAGGVLNRLACPAALFEHSEPIWFALVREGPLRSPDC